MKKVTNEEAYQFYQEWEKNKNHLRFGQAFLNHFFPDVVDSDLFYSESLEFSWGIIIVRYLEERKE